MSNKTNKFLRVKHHLKSEQIDEKIAVLEGAPTNSTQNLMTVEPSVQVASTEETVSLGLDFDKGNDDDDGKDTSGVFGSDGTILTVEPDVGDTSYILGPMASMWYAWGNFTRIGYIRESDRKMVNLGSITGQLGAWDGSSNFTSYGQLTVEQALWFQEIGKKDGANNDTPNYRAFYPGPPSSTADAFGRYLAVIVGDAKTTTTGNKRSTSNPINAPEDATTQFSMLAWWDGKGKKDAIDKLRYDPNHPDGTNQPNPFEPGTTLYKNFEKQRAYDKHGLLGSAPSDDVKIAGAGGSPGQPYTPPKEDPNNPYVPAPGRKLAQFPTDPTSDATSTLGVQDGDMLASNEIKSIDNVATSKEKAEWKAKMAELDRTIERTDAELKAARDEMKALALDFGLDVASVIGALATGGLSTAPAVVRTISKKVGKGVLKKLLNKFKTKGQKKADRKDFAQRMRDEMSGKTTKNSNKDVLGTNYGDKTDTGGIGGYTGPKNLRNSYKSQGKLLSEERIWLREIKKPVKVPELQKKFKGIKPTVKKKGDYKVVGAGLMKDNIAPPEFSPTRENRLWRKYEVNQNRLASQEKKNQVLELIGEGDHQWNYMLGNETWRSSSQMKKFYGDHDYLYDYYYGGKKHKVLRKEGLEKDFLLFIEDENGFKDTILQTELNELLAEERDEEDFKEYYMKETEQKEREKNFDRATRLKSIVGRIKRDDIKPEYPKEAPPKMVNGYHPKFGKKYKYNKLDPVSARSMPPTGDPEIDANVEKAKKKPK
tara:strand:+ start:669 stop:2966 length:2298 start_codon:yes stop_codon:yes gene_type:complete